MEKKSHARQLTLKNICFKSPKKIDARKMLTLKNSCGAKIPHPPHNFSNGPLITKNTERVWKYCNKSETYDRVTEFKSEVALCYS